MGTGELVGGQDINNAFFQSFKDAFEGNVWGKVTQRSHAGEIHDMETDFESKKVAIGLENTSEEELMLLVPDIFQTLLSREEIKLKDSIKTEFSIIGRKFYFSSVYIRNSLFNETIQRVQNVLKDILKREQVESIHKIVLIGGFAESPIVVGKIREFVQKNFPGRELYVPTSPLTAVLSGAVLFGHDPFIFYSRICRATYGIDTNSKFESKTHREDKKWRNEETGKYWCRDIFDIHVEKGSSVKLGQELPSKIYYPLYKDQKSMRIPIFMSDKEHLIKPVYTTDAHCKKLGEITVKMTNTTGGTSRKVIVTMIYGGTELDVIAKDETTGEQFSTTLRFD